MTFYFLPPSCYQNLFQESCLWKTNARCIFNKGTSDIASSFTFSKHQLASLNSRVTIGIEYFNDSGMLTDLEALPILEVSENGATYTCCVSITKTTYWLAAKHDFIFLKMPSNLGSLLRPLVPQQNEYAKLHSPQVMQNNNIKNCQNMESI